MTGWLARKASTSQLNMEKDTESSSIFPDTHRQSIKKSSEWNTLVSTACGRANTISCAFRQYSFPSIVHTEVPDLSTHNITHSVFTAFILASRTKGARTTAMLSSERMPWSRRMPKSLSNNHKFSSIEFLSFYGCKVSNLILIN